MAGILTSLPGTSTFPKISVASLLGPREGQLTAAGQSGILTQHSFGEHFFVPILIGYRTMISAAKVRRKNDLTKE